MFRRSLDPDSDSYCIRIRMSHCSTYTCFFSCVRSLVYSISYLVNKHETSVDPGVGYEGGGGCNLPVSPIRGPGATCEWLNETTDSLKLVNCLYKIYSMALSERITAYTYRYRRSVTNNMTGSHLCSTTVTSDFVMAAV